ncbi:MAG: hypothetical protein PUC98_07250 [Clostridiales bacterium]|nr:hypothetical protein [Clostridiales bacterium]
MIFRNNNIKKRNYTIRSSGLLLLSALILVSAAMFSGTVSRYAYAAQDEVKDYSTECWWDDNYETGKIGLQWEKCESKTKYKVEVFKGSSSKPLRSWTQSGIKYDLSQMVSKKGTGIYYFTVEPVSGGESYKVRSDDLEIDSDYMKKIKAYVKQKAQDSVDTTPGWHMYPNGTWVYYNENREMLKNAWLDYNGDRYHFSSAGIMQTGWQAIDKYWYYFGNDGKLYHDTRTPEGRYVNADGIWVDESSGTGVSSKGSSRIPATLTKLSSTTINTSEKAAEPGKAKSVTFSGGTGITVSNVEFSQPQEQWSAGVPVQVSMDLTANTNYAFTDSTKITCRGASGLVVSGSGEKTRHVTATYVPKTVLAQPSLIYMDDYYILHWSKVKHAERYKLSIYSENVLEETITINENSFDLADYSDKFDNDITLTIKLSALADAKKTRTYQESQTYVINSLQEFAETHRIDGEFRYIGTKLMYTDVTGEDVKNKWVNILGGWMHFNRSGYAEPEGWYKDTDGNWYYFGEDHLIRTGWLDYEGCRYYLRENENGGPFGSAVLGKAVIDGKEYHFNDGSRQDIPVAACY